MIPGKHLEKYGPGTFLYDTVAHTFKPNTKHRNRDIDSEANYLIAKTKMTKYNSYCHLLVTCRPDPPLVWK